MAHITQSRYCSGSESDSDSPASDSSNLKAPSRQRKSSEVDSTIISSPNIDNESGDSDTESLDECDEVPTTGKKTATTTKDNLNPPPTASRTSSTATLPNQNPPITPDASTLSYAKRKLGQVIEHRPRESDSYSDDDDMLPPPKRSRGSIIQHTRFWVPDGNVVLQVRNTQFRVHRSRLEGQSTVLRELFSTKLDGDGDFVNGIPVYHIGLVRVDDFTHLLTALDEAITYHFDPPSFAVLAGIVRASTELSFTKFRSYATTSLQETWSNDLHQLTTEKLPNAIEVISLARRFKVPGILKRAFYELLRAEGFDITDYASIRNASDNGMQLDENDARLGTDNRLTRTDLQKLIATREKLVAAWITAASMPSSTLSPELNCLAKGDHPGSRGAQAGATISESCVSDQNHLKVWIKIVHDSGLFKQFLYDPICGFDSLVNASWLTAGPYCHNCLAARKASWIKLKEELWSALDGWLNL